MVQCLLGVIDAVCDGFSDAKVFGGGREAGALFGVGHEAGLDENGRGGRIAQYFEVGMADAAISGGGGLLKKRLVDADGVACGGVQVCVAHEVGPGRGIGHGAVGAGGGKGISLDPSGSDVGGSIGVDGNKEVDGKGGA